MPDPISTTGSAGTSSEDRISCQDLALLPFLAAGLPMPVREFRFAPPRRWRFDFAWVEQKVAVEVDGGNWVRGRHARGAGIQRDNEKLNAAAVLGWRVLRYSPEQIARGEFRDDLRELLESGR